MHVTLILISPSILTVWYGQLGSFVLCSSNTFRLFIAGVSGFKGEPGKMSVCVWEFNVTGNEEDSLLWNHESKDDCHKSPVNLDTREKVIYLESGIYWIYSHIQFGEISPSAIEGGLMYYGFTIYENCSQNNKGCTGTPLLTARYEHKEETKPTGSFIPREESSFVGKLLHVKKKKTMAICVCRSKGAILRNKESYLGIYLIK
eukprot:m.38079 g.38079  ORF g.38079 m.38079 type:complete len:203 (+) comp32516_c0_seq3:742-1350(+)